MGPIGLPEMMALFVIALLLFGPKKLPELGRTLGKGLSEFRRAKNELKATFDAHMQEIERETRVENQAKIESHTPASTYTYPYESYGGYEGESRTDTRELTEAQQKTVEENSAAANPAAHGVPPMDTVARSNGYQSVANHAADTAHGDASREHSAAEPVEERRS